MGKFIIKSKRINLGLLISSSRVVSAQHEWAGDPHALASFESGLHQAFLLSFGYPDIGYPDEMA